MNKLEIFMKKHSPTILSIISMVGVVTTTGLAIKATPKAVELINEAKQEKEDELTTLELIKVAWKPYVPTVLSMFSTLLCIGGTAYLNQRTQATLISAYAALDRSYKEYVRKSQELHGDDSDIKKEIAKSKYSPYKFQNEDTKLFFDYQTMRYFESTFNKVMSAEDKLNEELAASGYVSVNDFYKFIGIEPLEYANHIGWSDNGDYREIIFQHQRVVIEDGLECWIIISNDGLLDYYNY